MKIVGTTKYNKLLIHITAGYQALVVESAAALMKY